MTVDEILPAIKATIPGDAACVVVVMDSAGMMGLEHSGTITPDQAIVMLRQAADHIERHTRAEYN